MSEAMYYTLLSLLSPRHGYGIMQHVEEISSSRVKLGPGTLYGLLSKMNKAKIIKIVAEDGKRKIYALTEQGLDLLKIEFKRITELYNNGIIIFHDQNRGGGDE